MRTSDVRGPSAEIRAWQSVAGECHQLLVTVLRCRLVTQTAFIYFIYAAQATVGDVFGGMRGRQTDFIACWGRRGGRRTFAKTKEMAEWVSKDTGREIGGDAGSSDARNGSGLLYMDGE